MERNLWRKEYLIILVLFLAFFLRVYHLGQESLWLDEGFSVTFADSNLAQIIKTSTYDAHPPLYYILLHYWITIFGDSEFSVRGLSALFGILSVFMIYKVGIILFDRGVGLICSIILGFSSFHIYYSQEARSYALVVLLTLISFYCLLMLLKDNKTTLSAGYAAANILLLYTHLLPGFIVLVAQNVYILSHQWFFNKKSTLRFRQWFFLQIVIVLFFLPWVLVVLMNMSKIQNQIAWIPKPNFGYLISCLKQFAGTKSLLMIFSIFAVFAFFKIDSDIQENFKKTLGRYRRRLFLNKSESIYLALIWFVVPIFFLYAVSIVAKPIFITRIAIPAMLGFFILISKGIKNLNNRYLITIVILIIAGFSAKNLKAYYFYSHKEEWRQVAELIEANAEKHDLVIFNSGTCLRVVYNYYAKSKKYNKISFPENGKIVTDENIEELIPLMEDYQNFWLVLSHSGDGKGLIIKNLAKQCYFDLFRQFWGIKVFYFKRKNSLT